MLALWDKGGPLMRLRTKDGRDLFIDELSSELGKEDLARDLKPLREAQQLRESLLSGLAQVLPAGSAPRL